MTTIDPRFAQLLGHLHRPDGYGHFWRLADKRSFWWNGDGPPAELPADHDLYFGVHPATESRGEFGRSTDETIAAINCLPADFDAKAYGGKAEALAHVEALEPAPSVVIDSGGGYHCYWLLTEPWALDSDAERARVKALQERWAAYVGGDPNAAKLPQLLRVPGTQNAKEEYGEPRPVEFVRCDLGAVYDLGELAALLPAVPAPAPRVAPPALPPVDDAPLGEGWEVLQRRAAALEVRRWLETKRKTIADKMGAAGDGARHAARLRLGKLAGGLVAAGLLSDDDAFTLVYDAQPPERQDKKERKAIVDGIAEGQRAPFAADDLPRVPTDKGLIARDGRAYCPACATEAQRSRYDYPGTTEPGWYCARCRYPMIWPLEAFTPAASIAGGDGNSSAPAAPTRGTLVHASRLGEVVERITWLIPGVLGLNAISQLFAPGGSGKSLLALDQALCVAQIAPVIYIAAEAAGEQEERVAAWCAHHGLGVGNLYFWPKPLTLKDPASVDAFVAEVQALQPALIVLDPLASCMAGLEESSTGDMTIAVGALNRIREATRAALNVVHHTGWADTHERGSSVLRNACRVVVKLSKDDTELMTLTCEKANNGKPFDARYFRTISIGDSVVPIPASKATTRTTELTVKHIAILEALSLAQHRQGASFTQILDTTEQGKSTLNKGIHRLIERGMIAVDGRTYTLTDAGRRELAIASTRTEFASSPAYTSSELAVNWEVNWERTNGELAHQDAEFTEFTADRGKVHPVHPDPAPEQFTRDTASQCDSSPQFTASSPSSSPSEFTSSPPTRSLERGESELKQQEQETRFFASSPDHTLTPLSEPSPTEVFTDDDVEQLRRSLDTGDLLSPRGLLRRLGLNAYAGQITTLERLQALVESLEGRDGTRRAA
jgi:hypothetical protein